ncbi:Lytic polysaccharide monooxygenase [Tuber magnatum]|uniref:Lytic polysaccharide monooxygenase n=1 Tax=Tuber magnatum TaxID=42249 RepID=A0A317SZ71_9PEZI|nr:Lytic polysaccharide monooxygenase [Tuber magnatum]
MKTSFSALAAALLLGSANAHIQLKSPVPFRTSTEAPQNALQKDFDMKAPLDQSGNNFPCKGYHKDAKGTQPLVDWPAGSTQIMSFDGQATHGGGSCQASLSEDGGASWKVMKSYIGGCPLKDVSFTVPQEAKGGPAIFAWTWFNNQGNREMYMNCAAVTITGGGSGLSAYPDMFTANIGNGCATVESTDLAFPNPGKNVEGSGGTPPTGSCGTTGSKSPAGGSPPNPKPTSVPQVTPPAPTTSSPNPTGTSAPTGTPKTSAPAGTQSPKPTGTGAPAPSSSPSAPSSAPSSYPQPPTGRACVEGTITCNADGTWSQCGSGVNQDMGKTAPGIDCTNGRMKRSIRFSSEHMARNA